MDQIPFVAFFTLLKYICLRWSRRLFFFSVYISLIDLSDSTINFIVAQFARNDKFGNNFQR